MSEDSKREWEEYAMDAIIVSLLRRVDGDDDYIAPKYLPEITEEERIAVESLNLFPTKYKDV